MKAPKLLILLLFIAACEPIDATDERLALLSGSYTITSFKSNIAVDLNNDGVSTEELTLEIDSFGLNDLEIRPTEQQTNPTQLASFFFPQTWITFEYPGEPAGFVSFLRYGFGSDYELSTNSLTLMKREYTEQLNIDSEFRSSTVSLTSDLNIVDESHLSLTLTKDFYDFSSAAWVTLDIEITYEKE